MVSVNVKEDDMIIQLMNNVKPAILFGKFPFFFYIKTFFY